MLISIDEKDPRPLYQQVVAQVKEQVVCGDVQPGEELPSVRELAGNLGVNLHTVRSAYLRLRDQGVIDLRLGRRACVARRQGLRTPKGEAELSLGARVRDLVTDALVLGLTVEDLHALIDRHYGRESEVAHEPTDTEDTR